MQFMNFDRQSFNKICVQISSFLLFLQLSCLFMSFDYFNNQYKKIKMILNEAHEEQQLLPPEQIILQSLSHFFMTSNAKKLPFYKFFTFPAISTTNNHKLSINEIYKKNINSLAYLYPFLKAQYHKQLVEQIFATIIQEQSKQYKKITQPISQIKTPQSSLLRYILTQSTPIPRKILLTRYLSLSSSLGNVLLQRKIRSKFVEEQFIKGFLSLVSQQKGIIEEDEFYFMLNKIIMTGNSQLLVDHDQFCSIYLEKVYPQLMKKNKILYYLLEGQKKIDKFRQLMRLYPDQSIAGLISLINQDSIKGKMAKKLYDGINMNKKIIKAILDDLLIWWTEGNDEYLLKNQINFRTNLLVLILSNFSKQQLTKYSCQISVGIQRRMSAVLTKTKKKIIQMVWYTLIKGMELQTEVQLQKHSLLEEEQNAVNQENENISDKQEIVQCHSQENKIDDMEIKIHPEQSQQTNQMQEQIFQLQPPRNIYDCILGLRNPSRKKITLKYLPNILRRNPEDLIFSWKQLIAELLYDMSEDNQPSLRAAFICRSSDFINEVGARFFTKETTINDKLLFIKCLINGIEELSSQPQQLEPQESQTQFYFKKVSAKYYKEEPNIIRKQPSKTRRWGHTRIAHEKKLLTNSTSAVSLKIIDNNPYINRLYEIANHLFFAIITKLSLLSNFPKQRTIARQLLKLLATLSSNLQNHIEKYKILSEITEVCFKVVEYLQLGKAKQSFIKEEKESCLAVLEVLNKISLVIDENIPLTMIKNLEKCLMGLRRLHQFGIAPIISMIEGNLFSNIGANKNF